MMSHTSRVQVVADQIRQRIGGSGFASLAKSSPSHFVPDPRDPKHRDRKIDVRGLDHVLEIDVEGRRCVAEPGVTFARLVDMTLPLGLVPKLVPELESITLGGAIAGCSVESTSFRYGGFHDTCRSYEMVTGNGQIVTCSPEHDRELFDMVHGSYGTLGVLTKVEFDLMPALPFVRLEYRHLRTFEQLHAEMMECCERGDHDFVDAIVHGPDHLVLCLGSFARRAPRVSNYRGVNIFYKSTRTLDHDWLTTRDYFFRYDTECHWLTRTLPVPGMESAPMRLLFGKLLLGSTNILSLSERLRPVLRLREDPHVVVDVFIPEPRLGEFWAWYLKTVDFFPLWVVPYRAPAPYPWLNPAHAARNSSPWYIDCAVYGKRNTPAARFDKLLEDKTYELGGIKTLISRNSYDEETFWSIYDRERYERVKRRLDPHNLFRELYEKVHRRR
jgi:FAD/FMN-containing dehydrogenase